MKKYTLLLLMLVCTEYKVYANNVHKRQELVRLEAPRADIENRDPIANTNERNFIFDEQGSESEKIESSGDEFFGNDFGLHPREAVPVKRMLKEVICIFLAFNTIVLTPIGIEKLTKIDNRTK